MKFWQFTSVATNSTVGFPPIHSYMCQVLNTLKWPFHRIYALSAWQFFEGNVERVNGSPLLTFLLVGIILSTDKFSITVVHCCHIFITISVSEILLKTNRHQYCTASWSSRHVVLWRTRTKMFARKKFWATPTFSGICVLGCSCFECDHTTWK